MSSKLKQLTDQVASSQQVASEELKNKGMSDLSRLDETLLSSVAGGNSGGGTLASGYNPGYQPQAMPYIKYWQDM
jgi:hypothetical protein